MAGKKKYFPALFKHANKLERLLDMMYKPSEIAEELGVTYDTVVRSYIPAGCPVVKDATGHKWIHGLEFATWANEIAQARLKQRRNNKDRVPLAWNEAYCMRCKKRVTFKPTKEKAKTVRRGVELINGVCTCGCKVNKFVGIKQT